MAGTTNTIDLSQLPVPTVIETLDVETILSQQLADYYARMQAAGNPFTALVESDPAYKMAESCAYRELLLRQRVNEAAKAIMIAYAAGADLDQIAANYNVTRLLIAAGDPTAVPPTSDAYEDDASLLRRVLLSFEGFSTAGPVNSYIFHALSASADVLDASCVTLNAGTVTVSVLSRTGNGSAPADTIAAVTAALNDEDVRPLCDTVNVQTAGIQEYTIEATIYVFDGPDADVIMQNAQDAAQAFADDARKLGRDIALAKIYAALGQPGVQDVVLTAPTANIVRDKTQAAYCTAINLTLGGVND